MTLKDVDEVVNWLDKSSHRILIQLLGGEPMLHPNLSEIIGSIRRGGHEISTIFTNGLGDTKLYRQLVEDNVAKSWLVNINEPNTYPIEEWKLLNRNLEILRWKDEDVSSDLGTIQRLQLGINLYYPEQDCQYLIDLAKEYECPYVRISVSYPCHSKSNTYTDFEKLVKMKPTLLKFIRDCAREDIAVGLDDILPLCVFTPKEIVYLAHFLSNFSSTCVPKFDILDLKVAYCVPMRGILPLYDIRKMSFEEMFKRYISEAKRYKDHALPRCRDCQFFRKGQCQGFCLRYKADLMK